MNSCARHIYTHTHTHVHTEMHPQTYNAIHTHTHTHSLINIQYAHTHNQTHSQYTYQTKQHTPSHIHHTHQTIRKLAHTHPHTHTPTPTPTHTHTHTHLTSQNCLLSLEALGKSDAIEFGCLSSLNLNGCTGFTEANLTALSANTPNLRSLRLRECAVLTDDILKEALPKWPDLEVLDVKVGSERARVISRCFCVDVDDIWSVSTRVFGSV
jgi:hypothetical protein